MDRLRFGTAGIPLRSKGVSTIDAMAEVRKLGLDAFELEFVHSVNVSAEKAPLVRKAAEENDIAITCHGSYYINLNAADKGKVAASKQRLYLAAKVAHLCGGRSVTFHPAYYLTSSKEDAYKNVRNAIKEVVEKLKSESISILVRPETTGRITQLGDLDETLKLCQELEQVAPCLDYAHLRARQGFNDEAAFAAVLEKVEKMLGKDALKNMHIQFAGVNFSDKGEKNHLPLKESDLNWEAIIKTWKDFNIRGVAVSESPNIEEDALLMKRAYEQ